MTGEVGEAFSIKCNAVAIVRASTAQIKTTAVMANAAGMANST